MPKCSIIIVYHDDIIKTNKSYNKWIGDFYKTRIGGQINLVVFCISGMYGSCQNACLLALQVSTEGTVLFYSGIMKRSRILTRLHLHFEIYNRGQ